MLCQPLWFASSSKVCLKDQPNNPDTKCYKHTHFRAIKGSEPNKLNDEETVTECVDAVISGREDDEEEDDDDEEDIEEENTMEENAASCVGRKDDAITVQ